MSDTTKIQQSSTYAPENWYWLCADVPDKVFSSKRTLYVPLDDATYMDWLQVNRPTMIDSGINLYSVIQEQVLARTLAVGVEVEFTSFPALNGIYQLDQRSQAQLSGIATGIAAGMGIPGGGATFIYNGFEFTSVQFLALATALANYVYNYNLGLGTYLGSGGMAGSLPPIPIVIA